jgi:hypothetical protein
VSIPVQRKREPRRKNKITMHVSMSTWRKKAKENQAFADTISLTEAQM